MSSITTWTRLESHSRLADISAGLEARVHDPAWLLGRQWQLGEFQGEDAGSPISARLRVRSTPITRVLPHAVSSTEVAEGLTFSIHESPLETLVEREPAEDLGGRLRQSVAAGILLMRVLDHHGLSQYISSYFARFPLMNSFAEASLDLSSARFLAVLGGRVPDGLAAMAAIAPRLRPPPGETPHLLPEPHVEAADRPGMIEALGVWLDELAAQAAPAGGAHWNSERLEYALSTAARPEGADEIVLVAPAYAGGRLEWHAFDVAPHASLGAEAGPPAVDVTAMPTPIRFAGMPALRFWEIEESEIDLHRFHAGPEELLRLLFLEFWLVYGNDWFTLPLPLAVGTVNEIVTLDVTDTFGGVTAVAPIDPGSSEHSRWQLFRPSRSTSESAPPLFFLPPKLGPVQEGSPIEEVSFFRDEMANVVWAMERTVEGPLGVPVIREVARTPATGPPSAAEAVPLIYRAATDVPECWIPFIPVVDGAGSIHLTRARLAGAPDRGDSTTGRILSGTVQIREEAVPREGVRVRRAWQRVRWIDGSTHVWVGRQKVLDRSRSASGLAFDLVIPRG